MTTTSEESPQPQRRSGPKARGRTVAPLTITITPAQRAALEERADAQRVSISTVIRQFIAAGLVAETAGRQGMDGEGVPSPRVIGSASAAVPDPAPGPVTIVVIDDDPRIVAFVGLVLEDEGYRVATWHSGAGARDFIIQEGPAAVLLDMELETRNAGLRVREQIEADPSLRAIPVILASARAGSVGEGVGAGGRRNDPVLVKPYTAEALIAAVAHAVASGRRQGVKGS